MVDTRICFFFNHAISHFDLSFPVILLLQMLGNVLVFAKTMPSLFAPFYEDFFVNASDPYQTRALKLEILTIIATEPSIPAIFEEFQVIVCSCNISAEFSSEIAMFLYEFFLKKSCIDI